MFDFLRGTLKRRDPEMAVVETNGLGWTCQISRSTFEHLPADGEVKIYTHLYVTENDYSLYGFHSRSERDLFRILISANRIGARTAISLLSEAPPNRIAKAIVHEETSVLKQATGIGKKTAERMIVELKDKIGDFATEAAEEPEESSNGKSVETSLVESAVEALTKLGYPERKSRKAVNRAVDQDGEVENTSELVKQALKEVS